MVTSPEYVGPLEDPDRYELLELLGRDRDGELWRAVTDVRGHAVPVTIRVFYPASALDRTRCRARWQRQAALLGSLEHAGLVEVREVFEGSVVHDADRASGGASTVYLVTGWARGESLLAWASHHANRDVREVMQVVARVASAVDYLHSGAATRCAPVVHGNLEPVNVVVDGAEVRLVDFGFVHLVRDPLEEVSAYVAPEVRAGVHPTTAADRYAVGATGYFLLTGEDPMVHDRSRMRARLLRVPGLSGRPRLVDHILAPTACDPASRPADLVRWSRDVIAGIDGSERAIMPLWSATG